ncbi:epoxide hydrolase family protein [Burkholderia cenocepacia]|uniref:epoxide hydrolase family protein n=1 Tax=Burkholderia cenocepacia TaxID=95486 RepID=UPI000483086D|nr:epoxide hydrolase family protein [Burkholderia cenocepacia]KOR22404.1 multidrug MFS transporter [Burkholderia cenocepacia]MBN3566542.1 epoxide hydrolase [Burkholderia cenocepacia]MBR7980637.1 epoxide hydrolase [Burkholderia cenocepacia]MBR7991763.1 epoxide hydrolase [Burkholderia cenocepacia]MBR8110005.1 epoxide hydrolase [Burkholderia cenocepacia]
MHAEPFDIAIPDQALDDLRRRVRDTRPPNLTPAEPWQQGVDGAWLRELAAYWADGFDWRAAERALNRLPQFVADVGGRRVHFVHRRGTGPKPYPLVVTHGWPGSAFEFHALIDRLCNPAAFGGDPDDAFDIVAPSLPGFLFSPAPAAPGTSALQVADCWAALMAGLGYPRFGAQGGDLGAGVSVALGARHEGVVDGIHLNYLPGSYDPPIDAARPLTDDEQAFLKQRGEWAALEGGYAYVHMTKPQTLAVALNDSPLGLAAWIGEKFRAWSDCDGDVARRFSHDTLLTGISLYWFTGCIGSSMQMYWENRLQPMRFAPGQRLAVPVGFARFPKEISRPPRSWLERVFDVVQWTDMPSGGHFAAMEEPDLLADDIRRFFRRFR